jgi:hypothetical protein
MKKLMLVASAALMMLPLAAAARGRSAVFAGPRFYAGPRFVPSYRWFGYGYDNPFYAPYAYRPYGVFRTPNTGDVKLDTKVKDAQVFINGAYAGTAGKLKNMHLRPGSYNIELRAPGLPTYSEKVYVMAGKTVHVNPGFAAEGRR